MMLVERAEPLNPVFWTELGGGLTFVSSLSFMEAFLLLLKWEVEDWFVVIG